MGRVKTCKVCRIPFEPSRPMQSVCSPECALLVAMKKTRQEMLRKASAERQDTLAKRKAMRSMSELRQRAQKAFNAYIRERDAGEPCIACGRFHEGQWHAGHYLTTAAHPELRYDPRNCHKSCQPCNLHLSGNLVEYRKGLIRRYGIWIVEWLEGPHEPKHYSRADLIAEEKKWQEECRVITMSRKNVR